MPVVNVQGSRIDRGALHRVIYRRANRNHVIVMNLVAFAEEIGVDYVNLTRIITHFVEEGRLRVVGTPTRGRPRTFIVEDPAIFGA